MVLVAAARGNAADSRRRLMHRAIGVLGFSLLACQGHGPGPADAMHASAASPPAAAGPGESTDVPPVDCVKCDCPPARCPGSFGWPPRFAEFHESDRYLDEFLHPTMERPERHVRVVYEEWSVGGHVRVAARYDGLYSVEVDGMAARRGFAAGGSGGSGFPQSPLMMSSCAEPADGDFYAQAIHFVYLHSPMYVSRSSWTSPRCSEFPRALAGSAWDLVERATGGAVRRPDLHVPRAPSR